MSGIIFENIYSALKFTATPPPSFQDKFNKVRKMIVAWNDHMQKVFVSFWISFLDEYFYKFSSFGGSVLINNSYMNDNTCGSQSKTINVKISQILDKSCTHSTE